MIVKKLIQYLEEDVPFEDITSKILPKELKIRAKIITREDCIIAGLEIIKELLKSFNISFKSRYNDGDFVKSNDSIAILEGNARNIFLVERTCLNILSRMSGIATKTRRIVDKVRKINKRVIIAATRKTCPGFQFLDKLAVEIGGGSTHRYSLSDMILIKKNHVRILGLEEAIKRARRYSTFKKIEVEVEDIDSAIKAAELGADIIMLDNMEPKNVEKVLEELRKRNLRDKVLIEVSGGINEENILEYAKLDIDIISIGELTHSVKSIDMSLIFEKILENDKE